MKNRKNSSQKHKSVLLPNYLVPERYRIVLKPDLDKCTFAGEETIYFKLKTKTKELVFHSLDLKIKNPILKQGKTEQKPIKIFYDKKSETVKFSFKEWLPTGKAELSLVFDGVLNQNMCGFYQSSYSLNGEKKILATTQFESTDARRAFVCVDEPSAKAIFDVSLVVPNDKSVISNTHELDVKEHHGGYKVVSFAPTPKMSTYLLAFIVGDFEYIEKKTKEGILIRVFTTPGKKRQAEFALEVACKTLSFYTDYFGIPYPLPLLDMIAIPDFAAGAMENWGAVTYRETALLIDPKHSSASARQRVALVVAHELAHQWFGNLTTMKWWTHLWLNEGFASWIEYLALDHCFPEWDVWTRFVVDTKNYALSLDALKNTHPIEVPVSHPSEIGEIFDAISYDKGGSVINMLHSFLGDKDFKKGLHNYLSKNQYKNATTEDLWKAFKNSSGKPVAKIAGKWTKEEGYPVVSADIVSGNLVLNQRRFFSSGELMKKNKKPSSWKIPLNISMEDKVQPYLLEKTEVVLSIKVSKKTTVNLNLNQKGFYRVLYSEELLANLLKKVADKSLTPADRVGLLNDRLALSKACLVKLSSVLSMLSYYKQEDNYSVWKEISLLLDSVDNLLWDTAYYSEFKKLAVSVYLPMLSKVGWTKKKGETNSDALLRELVLAGAGKYGDQKVINKAKELFEAHLTGKKLIDPDLRVMVYSLVAKNGTKKEYDQMMELFKKEQMHEEKNRLAVSFCKFGQKSLIEKTLKFALSPQVRKQDAPILFIALGANNVASGLAWDFVKANWQELRKRYENSHHLLGRFVQGVTNDFKREDQAEDVKKFFAIKKNFSPSIKRTVAQIIEQINSRVFWFKNSKKDIEEFFVQ